MCSHLIGGLAELSCSPFGHREMGLQATTEGPPTGTIISVPPSHTTGTTTPEDTDQRTTMGRGHTQAATITGTLIADLTEQAPPGNIAEAASMAATLMLMCPHLTVNASKVQWITYLNSLKQVTFYILVKLGYSPGRVIS